MACNTVTTKAKSEAFVVDLFDGAGERKKKNKSLQDAFIKYKKKRQVGNFHCFSFFIKANKV